MRFNRAAVVVFAGLIASLGSAAFAQNFVKPGDTVSIPFPVENAADSGDTINSMKVVVTGDSSFVTNPTDSATQSLALGEVKTFTPTFVVGKVIDGTYTVTLKQVSTDVGLDPDPDDAAGLTVVSFKFDKTKPVMTLKDARGTLASGAPTNAAGLVITVDDGVGPAVSGPGRIELWKDGAVFAASDQDYVAKHDYTSAAGDLPALGNLPEGAFTVKAFDQAGNEADPVIFKVDRTVARITVLDDDFRSLLQGGRTNSRQLLVGGNDLKPDGVSPGSGVFKIRLSGPGFAEESVFAAFPTQESVNFPKAGGSLPPGYYTARVEDAAGNVAEVSELMVDNAAPVVSIFDSMPLNGGGLPGRGWKEFTGLNDDPVWLHHDPVHGTSFRVLDTFSGFSKFFVTDIWDQQAPVPENQYAFTVTPTGLADGTGFLTSAEDLMGNATRVAFNVDSARPLVPFKLRISPELGVRAQGTATDAVSGVSTVTAVDITLPVPPQDFGYSTAPAASAAKAFDFELPATPVPPQVFCSSIHGCLDFVNDKPGKMGIMMVQATDASRLQSMQNNVLFVTGPSVVESVGNSGIGAGGMFTVNPTPTNDFGHILRAAMPDPSCIENTPADYAFCSAFPRPAECSLPCYTASLRVSYDRPAEPPLPASGITLVNDAPSVHEDYPLGPDTPTLLNIPLGRSFSVGAVIGQGPNQRYHPGYVGILFGAETLGGSASTDVAPIQSVGSNDVTVTFQDPVTITLRGVAPGRNWVAAVHVDAAPPPGLRLPPAAAHSALAVMTNASYRSPVTVSLSFSTAGLTSGEVARAALYELGPGGWREAPGSVDPAGVVTGQAATLSTFAVFIKPVPSAPTASLDEQGGLWQTTAVNGVWSLSRRESSDQNIFSRYLPGAAAQGSWSLGFDVSGNGYALQTSSGAQAESVLYKVTPRGALASVTRYPSLGGFAAPAADSDGDALWFAGVAGGSAALWKADATGLSLAASSHGGAATTVLANNPDTIYFAGVSGETSLWRYRAQTGTTERFVWANTLGGVGSSAQALVEDADGDVWLSGWAKTGSGTAVASSVSVICHLVQRIVLDI